MGKTKKAPTQAKAWKGKSSLVDLTLPSGNVCLAKRPGMETFLAQGKVPNSLMPIIQETIDKAKGGKPTKVEDLNLRNLFDDAEKMMGVIEFQNAVVLAAVKQPKVLPVPESEDDRDEDELYIDEVEPMDKAFIFQWALGGASDLEKFREGLAEAVADLPESETVGSSAE